MRKLSFTAVSVCLLWVAAFSQEEANRAIVTKEDYLRKSKSQKTAGWILLGTAAVGVAIAAPGNVDFSTLGIIAVGSAIATVTSITLFIASSRNKKKAMAMTAGMNYRSSFFLFETTPVPVPEITFRISF